MEPPRRFYYEMSKGVVFLRYITQAGRKSGCLWEKEQTNIDVILSERCFESLHLDVRIIAKETIASINDV